MKDGILNFGGPAPGTLFEGSGWGGVKVLWVVFDAREGPIRVRGKQLDGDHEIRFDGTEGRPLAHEIVVMPKRDKADGGRRPNRPSYVRLQAPGCYAFQFDTATGREIIVVKAVGPVIDP